MTTLILIILMVGIPLILVGIVISKQPTINSGYGKMSQEELTSDNRIKVIRNTGRGFIAGGMLSIVGGTLSYIFKWDQTVFVSILSGSILLPVFFSILQTRLFSKKQFKRDATFFITTLAIIAVGVTYASSEATVTIDGGKFKVSGLYGENIQIADIEHVELVKNLPGITLRTNGYSLANINKGYFSTDTKETVKLFIHSKKKPYIRITKNRENRFISTAGSQKRQRKFTTNLLTQNNNDHNKS
jgi:hypothetical protein